MKKTSVKKNKKPDYLKQIAEDISAIRASITLLGATDILVKPTIVSDTITFPQKTAKEIMEECDNKVNGGKLLFSTGWYENEDLFTKETCRPRTVTIPTEISDAGKSWNELKDKEDQMFNFAEIVYMLRESESFRKLLDLNNPVRYTWTNSRSSVGILVRVGFFDSGGAGVGRWEPGHSVSSVGVCLSRS